MTDEHDPIMRHHRHFFRRMRLHMRQENAENRQNEDNDEEEEGLDFMMMVFGDMEDARRDEAQEEAADEEGQLQEGRLGIELRNLEGVAGRVLQRRRGQRGDGDQIEPGRLRRERFLMERRRALMRARGRAAGRMAELEDPNEPPRRAIAEHPGFEHLQYLCLRTVLYILEVIV